MPQRILGRLASFEVFGDVVDATPEQPGGLRHVKVVLSTRGDGRLVRGRFGKDDHRLQASAGRDCGTPRTSTTPLAGVSRKCLAQELGLLAADAWTDREQQLRS